MPVFTFSLWLTLIASSTSYHKGLESCYRTYCSIKFDEQLQIHQGLIKTDSWNNENKISIEDFWTQNKHPFGIPESQFSHTHRLGNGVDIHHYDQYFNGVKVLGARLILTSGAHGGIIKAVAENVIEKSALPVNLNVAASITPELAFKRAKDYIQAKFSITSFHHLENEKVELLIYRRNFSSNKPGNTPILVYCTSGGSLYKTNEELGTQALTFTAFVDATTGAIVDFNSRKPSPRARRKTESKNIDKSRKLYDIPESFELGEFRTIGRSILLYNCSEYPVNEDSDIYDCLNEDANIPTWSSINPDDTFPTGNARIDSLIYDAASFTRMMRSISGQQWQTFQRSSTPLRIFYNLPSYGNAFYWLGRMLFGEGVEADDILGHEYGHGYTESTADFLYEYQSGALDESFADVLGESFDILNGYNDEPIAYRDFERKCTSNSYFNVANPDPSNLWEIAEDSVLNTIRDMYYPECWLCPGRITSSFYECSPADNGGVHTNSGISNRIFSSMVQGANDINGDPVYGIGLNKSLAIHWQALLQLGPLATFEAYAEAVASQCEATLGSSVYMPDLVYGASILASGSITQEDCDAVDKFIRNSEILTETICSDSNYTEPPRTTPPTRDPTAPSELVALSATPDQATLDDLPSSLAFDNFDGFYTAYLLYLCPGINVQISTCEFSGGSTSGYGRPYIRIQNVLRTEELVPVAINSCGVDQLSELAWSQRSFGAFITFDTYLPCQKYRVEIGCYIGFGACAGNAAIVAGTLPGDVLVRSPTPPPSYTPSVLPTTTSPTTTASPTTTVSPTAQPSDIPTAVPTFTASAVTQLPSFNPTLRPTIKNLTPSTPSDRNSSGNENDEALSLPFVIGIFIGGLVFLLLCTMLIRCYMRSGSDYELPTQRVEPATSRSSDHNYARAGGGGGGGGGEGGGGRRGRNEPSAPPISSMSASTEPFFADRGRNHELKPELGSRSGDGLDGSSSTEVSFRNIHI